VSVLQLPLIEDEQFVLDHVRETALRCGYAMPEASLRAVINATLVAIRNRQEYRIALEKQRAELRRKRQAFKPLRPEEV
jgi:hypothetical protein